MSYETEKRIYSSARIVHQMSKMRQSVKWAGRYHVSIGGTRLRSLMSSGPLTVGIIIDISLLWTCELLRVQIGINPVCFQMVIYDLWLTE